MGGGDLKSFFTLPFIPSHQGRGRIKDEQICRILLLTTIKDSFDLIQFEVGIYVEKALPAAPL